MFDPKQHKPTSERSGDDSPRLDKPGRYLVACKYVADHYGESKNGHPFVRCYFHVVAGERKGHWFREDVFVHAAAYGRLGSMANAVGFSEQFDPAKDLMTFAKMLLHRPFVGKVKAEAGSDGNRYARLAFSDPAIGDEVKIAKAYMASVAEDRARALEKLAEAIERKQQERDDFSDDPSPRGGSRSYEESFADDDGFDEELPF